MKLCSNPMVTSQELSKLTFAKVKKANDYMKRLQAHRALGRIQEEQPAIAPEPREAVPIDVKSLQKKQILAFFYL